MKYVLATLLLLNLSACSERASLQGEISESPTEKSTGIVGGIDATKTDKHIQHTVLITGKYSSGQSYNCTGTLIEKDIVLTATHCLGELETMKITFGNDPVHSGPIDILRAKHFLPHEKFNRSEEVRNDIALIQMEKEAPENSTPATLPWNSLHPVDKFTSVRVYGFGITSGVVEDGHLDTKTAGVLRTTRLKLLADTTAPDIFAVDQSEGHGICSGDSGGPAFVYGDIVVGVSSRSITDDPGHPQYADDDLCNYESIFTRVDYYKTWILDGIKALHKKYDFSDLKIQGP